MPRVVRTEQAENDIVDLLTQLGRQSTTAATRFRAALDRASRLLSRSPRLGRARAELDSDLRSYPILNTYIMYYRPVHTGIEIVRVLHGARDVDSAMFDG